MRSTRFNQPLYRQRTGTAAPPVAAPAPAVVQPATTAAAPPQTQTFDYGEKRDRVAGSLRPQFTPDTTAAPIAKPRPVAAPVMAGKVPYDQSQQATTGVAPAAGLGIIRRRTRPVMGQRVEPIR